MILILPVFMILIYFIGRREKLIAYRASHAIVLGIVYLYNFLTLRQTHGLGRRIFRFSLLVLSAAFIEQAFVFVHLYRSGGALAWAQYIHYEAYADFTLHCVLAFAAMAMWSESQIDRIRELGAELDHTRREHTHRLD